MTGLALDDLELSTADWAAVYAIPVRTMRHLIAQAGVVNHGRKSRPRYAWDDIDRLIRAR